MSSKKHTQIAIGLAISGFFLYKSFANVEFAKLVAFLKTINYWWALPQVFFIMLSMYLRAWRWKYLLPEHRNISTGRLFGPAMIGFGLNGIFPARAGEFLRPLALQKTEGVPFGEGMSTIVLERIFDGAMLLVLFAFVMMTMQFDPSIHQSWDARSVLTGAALKLRGALVLAGLGAVLVGVYYWLFRKLGREAARGWKWLGGLGGALVAGGAIFYAMAPIDPAKTYEFGRVYELSGPELKVLARKLSIAVAVLVAGVGAMMFRPVSNVVLWMLDLMKFIPAKLHALVRGMVVSFTDGLASLRSPLRVAIVIGISLAVWIAVVMTFWVTAMGIQGLQISFAQSLALMVIICFGIMLPSSPGFWGVFEFAGVFGLMLLGVTKDATTALGFILLVHMGQWLPTSGVGLYYMFKIGVSPAAAPDAGGTPADSQDTPATPATNP